MNRQQYLDAVTTSAYINRDDPYHAGFIPPNIEDLYYAMVDRYSQACENKKAS